MLNKVEWGEYRIGDLFDVTRGLSMYVKDKESFIYVDKGNKNAIPLVQQMSHSNGIIAYIDKTKLPIKFKHKIEKAGKITINPDQPNAYYQQKEFVGNSVIIIDTSALTKKQSLFIVAEINRIRRGSTWNDKFPKEEVKKAIIRLPQKHDGKIDYDLMESFISELEARHISELEAYLTATGLKDYNLSKEEQDIIDSYSNIEWKDFSITDIFEISNAGNVLARDIVEDSGDIPYLCASDSNNSISTYISYEGDLSGGNSIFIGGKTFTVTYQSKDFVSNDSHNLVLRYKNNDETNRDSLLFGVACVKKSLAWKYSWGDSVSKTKIKKDSIRLPINNGEIDWAIMPKLLHIAEKLVIKDVVDYSNRKIKATTTIELE